MFNFGLGTFGMIITLFIITGTALLVVSFIQLFALAVAILVSNAEREHDELVMLRQAVGGGAGAVVTAGTGGAKDVVDVADEKD